MKLTPALEFEKLREDAESWNKIFLHKDGKFFRAYEWSAWLIKTLVCSEAFQKERGLPIGNLTSQLFSNVYLNALDQFMKRDMKCRHYGRYVDDAYVVSCDKEQMKSIVPKVRAFLSAALGLELHMGKLSVKNANYGTEFLGAFVKPYRTYASNACLHRMERNIRFMDMEDGDSVYRSVNSFLGVLCHHKTYHIRRAMFLREKFLKVSTFNRDMTLFGKPTAQISL